MKLIIKGDLKILGQYDVIQGIYMILQTALDTLEKQPDKDDKKELIFSAQIASLRGYQLKLIKNKSTKTITLIIK